MESFVPLRAAVLCIEWPPVDASKGWSAVLSDMRLTLEWNKFFGKSSSLTASVEPLRRFAIDSTNRKLMATTVKRIKHLNQY
jgi:hypothetical protein